MPSDDPKFVLSKSMVLSQYNLLKSFCDQVSYSSKTNYKVAKILEAMTDSFFSLHSIENISQVKEKKRIWYIAQAWAPVEIKKLLAAGIENFVVDNTTDLNTLINFLSRKNMKVNLLLRMRLKEHTVSTGKHYVYGMYSHVVNQLIPKLRKNKTIGKLGIHVHRKTQNVSEWSLKNELEGLLEESTLDAIDVVNMGGGIPVKYKNFRVDVSGSVFSEIKKLRMWLDKKNIQLIIEAGRFIAAPSV